MILIVFLFVFFIFKMSFKFVKPNEIKLVKKILSELDNSRTPAEVDKC